MHFEHLGYLLYCKYPGRCICLIYLIKILLEGLTFENYSQIARFQISSISNKSNL